MKCTVEDCQGRVEASAPLWFSLDGSGTWSVEGVDDHSAWFKCDHQEHDNATLLFHERLAAYIESILPGSTWEGSDPRGPVTHLKPWVALDSIALILQQVGTVTWPRTKS